MSEKRKDSRGRILKTGEYWDQKNERYLFRKMVDGERVTITSPDLVELRRLENELLHNIDMGQRISSGSAKITLNDYFDTWMKLYAKGGRKATTCMNYANYFNKYIRQGIGRKPITKITKADIQRIINEMTADGKAHSTMANLKSCLNKVLESAIDDDIITKNVAKNIQLPQKPAKKRGVVPQEQLDAFMEYVRNSRKYAYCYPAFVVLFNTGMRIGEMISLTWENVNFADNTITISTSLNRYRMKEYGFTRAVASTKSTASDRIIPMSDNVRSTLLRLKMKAPNVTPTLPLVDDGGNIRGHVTGFIFLNTQGNTWSEPTFRDLILRITERYNREAEENKKIKIDFFSPHQCRHTLVSACYDAGVNPLATSQIVGHKSPETTLRVYTHLSQENQKAQENIIRSIKIS